MSNDGTYTQTTAQLLAALPSADENKWQQPWSFLEGVTQEQREYEFAYGLEPQSGTHYQLTYDVPLVDAAERILKGYKDSPTITLDGDQPRYQPDDDELIFPCRHAFKDSKGYYASLFHELAHSTAERSRLNRSIDNYPHEEVVAELTSLFLQSVAGLVDAQTIEQSADYIKGWLSSLEYPHREFVHALTQAHQAADYILGGNK